MTDASLSAINPRRVVSPNGVAQRRRWNAARRFVRQPTSVIGLGLLTVVIIAAALAPWLAPYGPTEPDFSNSLQGPSTAHLLGTDQLGRDLLSRLMYGGRVSLVLSVSIVAISSVLGTVLGGIAGYARGAVDQLVSRCADIVLAFPGLLLAIAITTVLGNGVMPVIWSAVIVSVPGYVRLVRGSVLSVSSFPYVEAARATGVPSWRILGRHILPNVLTPILVQCSVQLASVLLLISALSFLGIGVQPPTAEWGVIVSDGRAYLHAAFHLTLFGGLAIMIAVLGFNLVGDGLRDALDIRQVSN